MTWPTADHDVPSVNLVIPYATVPHYLYAFLASDGQPFRADDYAEVRKHLSEAVELFSARPVAGQQPNPDVSAQRWRTWKTVFDAIGLITVDDDILHSTRLGRSVLSHYRELNVRLDGANDHIARLGAEVLNRMLLRNPLESAAGVPDDSDLRPIRALWKAARALDDKLHWEELNRVLMHVHYEHEVDSAIERIRAARLQSGGSYTQVAAQSLGNAVVTDRRRITPWFSRAGMGGLFIRSEDDADTFRHLIPTRVAILDELLSKPAPAVPPAALTDKSAYQKYLMEPVVTDQFQTVSEADKATVDVIQAAVADFGASKIITLSGLPGTGKTRIARVLADLLTDGDPHRLIELQFHESFSYEDFVEGFTPRPDGTGFQLRPKALRVINDRAISDPERKYLLVMEEFTRANTLSVLGELLTYVEHRSRPFSLPLSQQTISIAPNLIFLATMNPRDRSALSLDAAMRRRMHVVEMSPSADALEAMLKGKLGSTDLLKLRTWFETYSALLPFGHGVFEGATDPIRASKIWRGTVIHLLHDSEGNIEPAFKQAATDFPWP